LGLKELHIYATNSSVATLFQNLKKHKKTKTEDTGYEGRSKTEVTK